MATIIKLMPNVLFVEELEKALNRKDGYIMCATGQDPANWDKDSWWFEGQYSGKQLDKALYWRKNAQRVWDCNGMAEGIYKDFSGTNINTKARYNYAEWCGVKGSGTIPEQYKRKGAAVFWGKTAASIHHVGYLYKPVKSSDPSGDWYIIEARGVMYGVVRTKLSDRNPNYWGLMTKYFDYGTNVAEVFTDMILGDRTLKNGCEGNDVAELQNRLIRLGYNCGSWGADGDFGDITEIALKKFQSANKLEKDGIYGPLTHSAMEIAITEFEKANQEAPKSGKEVKIVGGNCYVRSAPNIDGDELGIAYKGRVLPYNGEVSENGWLLVEFKNQNGWVSGKYGKLAM